MIPLGIFSALSFWYVPKLGLRLVLFIGTLLMAVGFACMQGLDLHSTYPEFAWPTLILAAGIGICTASTTSAIMGAVADEKQGVASAVNDTSREMGGALGIAVAGSILAGRYSHELAPRLADFPAAVRGPATDSLAKAVELAGKLRPQGRQLAELSKTAFLTAMHRFHDHDGRDRQPRGDPDRSLGARAGRAAAKACAPHSRNPRVVRGKSAPSVLP